MSFPTKTTFTLDWTTIPDVPTPGTYTAAQLKALFNARDQELLDFLNSIMAVLISVTLGSSGSENIGSAPIAGVAGGVASNPYAQIADLKAQINAAVTGTIPDRSIANTKLILATITAAEMALNSITYANADAYTQQSIQGGWLANYNSGRFF